VCVVGVVCCVSCVVVCCVLCVVCCVLCVVCCVLCVVCCVLCVVCCVCVIMVEVAMSSEAVYQVDRNQLIRSLSLSLSRNTSERLPEQQGVHEWWKDAILV
jgi:hypothetical protein